MHAPTDLQYALHPSSHALRKKHAKMETGITSSNERVSKKGGNVTTVIRNWYGSEKLDAEQIHAKV